MIFENFTFKQMIILCAINSCYEIKLFTYSHDKSSFIFYCCRNDTKRYFNIFRHAIMGKTIINKETRHNIHI